MDYGLWTIVFYILTTTLANAQPFTRYSYYDAAKQNIKEVYQVKDSVSNVFNGRYISYFLNGNIESKGQYSNNETAGNWEFYYETGNVKMRGILQKNSNYGVWEYFFEGGGKSMEGVVNAKDKEGEWKVYYESGALKEIGSYQINKRVGLWKTYFEDGMLKGEIKYEDNVGEYTEYYTTGKVLAKGPKVGVRNFGIWKLYTEEGFLQAEGSYVNGKKNGEWKYYYPSGKVSSQGVYENDEPKGTWKYYFEDGEISSSGDYLGGKKNGYWSSFNNDKSKKSETIYKNNSGEYREFYPDGKIRVEGQLVNGKSQGNWQYYFQNGKLEGECKFEDGKGTYKGYYPSGRLQTKGEIENDVRIGTWEMFDQEGKLSGYYKPFYDTNPALTQSITDLAKKEAAKPVLVDTKNNQRTSRYFTPKNTEYLGVILAGNPILSFVGSMPFGVEFYNQERLGHEFVFEGLRDPFFTADDNVPQGKTFSRGYAMALRQKYYNPLRMGMWYFGQEFRFTNLSYSSNVLPPTATSGIITANATEQKAEYGLMVGIRFMKNNSGDGITIDIFGGYSAGYRWFDSDPFYSNYFTDVSRDKFAHSIRLGLNIGYSLSFDGSGRRP